MPGFDKSLIAMANPPRNAWLKNENRAFLMIGQHLLNKGVSVPEILCFDLARGFFLMKDLGKQNLQMFVKRSTDPLPVYLTIVEELLRLQVDGRQGFDTTWCCQTAVYDQHVMRKYESEYFKDAFLGLYLGLKKDWKELKQDFDHLVELASQANANFFMHRDFQSRNIMVSGSQLGILDWQGGRLGPLAYDLASLLIDPYTTLPGSLRDLIYDEYVKLVGRLNPHWAEDIKRHFLYIAIQRNLQILGAFGFLTKKQHKKGFEQYIPPAVKGLLRLLEISADRYLINLKSLAQDLVGGIS